ncbi:MAG: hypothetical protein ACKVRN_14260 [Pyrinomonadaceae bacterium]
MDKELKERAIGVQEKIREVLFNEWDPIGVKDTAPSDEYDAYIGSIYRLLATGTTSEVLAAHLQKLEIEQMECPTSPEHRKKIAERLLTLNISLG